MSQFERIKMIKTTVGDPSGGVSGPRRFEAGNVYDVPPKFAKLLAAAGKCVIAKQSAVEFVFEDQEVGGAQTPPTSSQQTDEAESSTNVEGTSDAGGETETSDEAGGHAVDLPPTAPVVESADGKTLDPAGVQQADKPGRAAMKNSVPDTVVIAHPTDKVPTPPKEPKKPARKARSFKAQS